VSPTNPKQQAAIPFFGHTKILHKIASFTTKCVMVSKRVTENV